jgi:hypothetical protein
LPHNGFQDRRIKPLCHPSTASIESGDGSGKSAANLISSTGNNFEGKALKT